MSPCTSIWLKPCCQSGSCVQSGSGSLRCPFSMPQCTPLRSARATIPMRCVWPITTEPPRLVMCPRTLLPASLRMIEPWKTSKGPICTLQRWYVLHVLMLPFVIVIFMAIHFWRVRKDGGISGPL